MKLIRITFLTWHSLDTPWFHLKSTSCFNIQSINRLLFFTVIKSFCFPQRTSRLKTTTNPACSCVLFIFRWDKCLVSNKPHWAQGSKWVYGWQSNWHYYGLWRTVDWLVLPRTAALRKMWKSLDTFFVMFKMLISRLGMTRSNIQDWYQSDICQNFRIVNRKKTTIDPIHRLNAKLNFVQYARQEWPYYYYYYFRNDRMVEGKKSFGFISVSTDPPNCILDIRHEKIVWSHLW